MDDGGTPDTAAERDEGNGFFDRARDALASGAAGAMGGFAGGTTGMLTGGLIGLVRGLTNQPHPKSQTSALMQAAAQITGQVAESRIVAALEADPVKQETMRRTALEIQAADDENYREHVVRLVEAANKDREGARKQTMELIAQKNPMAWGAAVVSFIVLTAFGSVLAVVLTRAIPAGSETIVNVLLGTLTAMATSVVSYWVGSSVGSARKDVTINASNSSR